MSLIVLYFLHSTSVLSFYKDVVLTLSISTTLNMIRRCTLDFEHWSMMIPEQKQHSFRAGIECQGTSKHNIFCDNHMFCIIVPRVVRRRLAGIWVPIIKNNTDSWPCYLTIPGRTVIMLKWACIFISTYSPHQFRLFIATGQDSCLTSCCTTLVFMLMLDNHSDCVKHCAESCEC